MGVNDNNRVGSAFNVLEQLDDEDTTVVGPDDHAWEVLRSVERLLGDLFVTVEEAMLELSELILG